MRAPGSTSAFLRRLRRRLPLGVGLGAAVGTLVWLVGVGGALDGLEHLSFDARAKALSDPADADTSIAIVAIDDNSLEAFRSQLGRWPWPRETQAAIVEYLSAAGARLIVFDITFPEPDIYRPYGDTVFAAQIAQSGRVVLPLTVQLGDSLAAVEQEARLGLVERRTQLERFAIGAAAAAPGLVNHPFVEPADPLLLAGAAAVGTILLNADEGGVTRRSIPVYRSQGALYPNVALAAARMVQPERWAAPVRSLDDRELLLDNGTRLPLADGAAIIRWHGPFVAGGRPTYPVVSAGALLTSWRQVSSSRPSPTQPARCGAMWSKSSSCICTACRSPTFQFISAPLRPMAARSRSGRTRAAPRKVCAADP